jgi:hypothetical protein
MNLPRPSLGSLLLVAAAVACGGQTLHEHGDGGSGSDTGVDTGTGFGSSTGSGTGTGPGSGIGTGTGGGQCVELTVTAADTACSDDNDCAYGSSGQLCSEDCDCGEVPINTAAAAQQATLLSSIQRAGCPCASPGRPRCSGGQCILCGPEGCSDGGVEGGEAGTSEGGLPESGTGEGGLQKIDGGECVNIDLSTYDQSCTQPSDCILIFTGEVCVPSDCPCNQAFVNISEQPRYDQAINELPPDDCTCPVAPGPACLQGKCTLLNP